MSEDQTIEKEQRSVESEEEFEETEKELTEKPKPHEVKVPLTKGIFKASPVIKTERPRVPELVIPNLKPLTFRFARPKLLSIRIQTTSILKPKIFTVMEQKEECRISILEPLTISKLFSPFPKLKLEQPIDISVRPLIYGESIKALKILKPVIKVFHVSVPRPNLIPSFISQPIDLYKPKIHAISLGFKKEMVIGAPKLTTILESKEGMINMGVSEEETKDLLDELFPPVKGSGIHRWRTHMRPICLVVTGDSFDSREMLEDIISTKYTFHGEYRFSRNLPWQVKSKEVEIALQQRFRSAEDIIMERTHEKPSIYEKIISKDLIVSDKVTENNKDDIVRGLRDIANRGPKCVILYSDKLEPFLYLDKELGANIDIKFVRLPTYNDRTLLLIEKLIGVEPRASSPSIKVAWADSIRHYEKVIELLNEKLLYNIGEVPWDTESETELHYVMKKVVYHILKQEHKNVVAEKEIFVTDDSGRRIQNRPDISVNGTEFWEVETGYPTNEEKERLPEYFKPHVRLIEKLKKFHNGKVNVVVQSIYASLFIDELRKVKDTFKGIIALRFYTLHWSETEPLLKSFL